MAEELSQPEAADDTDLFESIFAVRNPVDQKQMILQLTWRKFEDFTKYVFECAGYTVQHIGSHPKQNYVDLLLFATPTAVKPIARVEVRRYRSATILRGGVLKFLGAMALGGNGAGYLVTTSDFTGPAYQAEHDAQARGIKLHLINGAHLLRYITYLRGSRQFMPDGHDRMPAPVPPYWLMVADRLPLRDPRETTVLAIANNKGGVGKTTTALNLGLALTLRGMRVLLVDLDGQANLTAALPLPDPRPRPPRGAPPPERDTFITDYFAGRVPTVASLVQPTRFSGVSLLAADERLHHLDRGGTAHVDAELAFVRAIHDPALVDADGKPFDWIILDTPPAQTFYTRLALAAAHYVVVPVHAGSFSAYGINRVLAATATMRGLMGDHPQVVGCVITYWQKAVSARNQFPKLEDALAARGIKLFESRIPYDDRIERANVATMGGGLQMLFHTSSGSAAVQYKALLDELLEEVRPHVHEPHH